MAQQPEKPAAAVTQVAARKFFRALAYFGVLLVCVGAVLAISYAAVLSFARGSAADSELSPDIKAEIRTLQSFLSDLSDIHVQFSELAEAGRQQPTDPMMRQLNDLRRRMRVFPEDSRALSSQVAVGDALRAWAANLGQINSTKRAGQSLQAAESATAAHLEALDPQGRVAR